jgi:hypothetical protein
MRSRRSWYSQTFSDDEGDDVEELSRWIGSEGSAVRSSTSAETCQEQEADANSDASTDVGSDDEGGKCLDDFEVEEARSRPSSTKAAACRVHLPEQVAMEAGPRPLESDIPVKKELDEEETAGMVQRRLLKRQRQREERREQRARERAERSARRKRS